MIRFSHFILPKILCGIGGAKPVSEAIEVASDIEHAQDEHGINPNSLVDYIKHHDHKPPENHKPWYALTAKPVTEEDLFKKNLDETHAALVKHYSGWTDSQRDIIHRYTSAKSDENSAEYGNSGTVPPYQESTKYAFRYINDRIMKNEPHVHDDVKMARMDDALKAHKTPHDLVVWSGINSDHTNSVLYSNKVHHPAYLSTSIMPGQAMMFSKNHDLHLDPSGRQENKHILKIHVPEGHAGGYIDHVSSIPGEHEFILPKDTILHIDHSKRQVHSRQYGHLEINTFIHHAYPVKE